MNVKNLTVSASGLGLWVLFGVALTTRNYLDIKYLLDGNATWWRSIQSELPDWLLWGLLGYWIAVYSGWVRSSRTTRAGRIVMHAVAAMAVALLHLVLSVSGFMLLSPIEHTGSWLYQLRLNLVFSFHWNLFVYCAIVLAEHAIASRREVATQRQQALVLQADLVRARLDALQLQIQPHFLFNALNTVAELVHERPDVAEQMIIGIGRLLRESLKSESQEVSLREELEMIRLYLTIEQVRFEDRLWVKWNVDDNVKDARVPRLLLQPIVENAVRHGLNRVNGGTIEIAARRIEDRTVLCISNSESRFSSSQHMSDGLGLRNTRDRLQTRYGERHHFACYNERDSAVVRIEIPWYTHSNETELPSDAHASLSC